MYLIQLNFVVVKLAHLATTWKLDSHSIPGTDQVIPSVAQNRFTEKVILASRPQKRRKPPDTDG